MNSGRFGGTGGSGFTRGSAQPSVNQSMPPINTGSPHKNSGVGVSGESFIGREYLNRKEKKREKSSSSTSSDSSKKAWGMNPRLAGMVFGALLLLFGIYQCSARVGTVSQVLDRKNPKSIFAPLKLKNTGRRN